MPQDTESATRYAELARSMGALHAQVVRTEQLVFDPRTILKCMFGCDDWGRNHTCPSRPYNLSIFEYETVLRRYAYGVLIHSNDKKTNQEISYEIERRAYLDGYHFAFSLADCAWCATCSAIEGKPCVHPKKARPAFHSVGIDVFTTVKQLGLPIAPLASEDEAQNWYAFVFIE